MQQMIFIADLIACSTCVRHHYAHNQELELEIKCQLDATDDFIADLIACSTCVRHHYAHHQELELEIKCQLDATDDFIADLIACSTCSGTTMPIIRSSTLYNTLELLMMGIVLPETC